MARFKEHPPVVVITGSSAGLGRAIAHAFAKKGAKVGLLARNPEALNAARSECEALGGTALALPTDVSDANAVEEAATSVEAEFGPIDIWVNDAMVSVFSPVKEMEASDYRRVTEVLYLGFAHGTLSALRRMLPRIAEKLSNSAPLYPIAPFRCNPHTAPASMQSTVSLIRCDASLTTTTAMCDYHNPDASHEHDPERANRKGDAC